MFKETCVCLIAVMALCHSTTLWADAPASFGQILAEAESEAISQILTAAQSQDAYMRANAIEAMQPLPQRALPLAQIGLSDANAVVRFTALVTIGKLRLAELGPAATAYLDDPNVSVQAASMFAAHQCGLEVDISRLAGFLTSSKPSVRGNAAMLLGEMGEPSTAKMLEDLAKTPMRRADSVQRTIVNIQIAEAMVRTGDDSVIGAIRAQSCFICVA